MKIKKFIAKDNQEALMKVKLELGSEAVIIHQRKVKQKGILGFFKKPVIEIVAAREENAAKVKRDNNLNVKNQFSTMIESMDKSTNESLTIESELGNIKQMLSQLISNEGDHYNCNKDENHKKTEIEENIFDMLMKNHEIDPEVINLIKKEVGSDSLSGFEKDFDQRFIHGIRRFVQENISIKPYDPQKKVIVFVGPTGVGKTTTIAKLAARATLNEGKEVGMISADTYRIAAVEQLKTYSDILNIPLEVVYNAAEIKEALIRLQNKDMIMIDTAGRNHQDSSQLNELKELLDALPQKEIYLLLSCTTRNHDIQSIIKRYDFLNDFKIIITKVDEASAYGPVVNIPAMTRKPISFFTTGQSVPDDIEVVTIDKVITLLIKETLS
ncbi:flagellar biosynthesis protein FlhF [Tindallia californiensis]|uniref:Flagellar biosynthesis protein FlhF n=1 Tax=Tindallia californiensis TaxID=159292 RepID=A0A1H3NR06_9FIRM|nr:flagellar biosynthesis protein FlhF [Tindallia californiensis]SDY91264.1 flagellar biosynthesis protein FlhF [Tindallia californiensis]